MDNRKRASGSQYRKAAEKKKQKISEVMAKTQNFFSFFSAHG